MLLKVIVLSEAFHRLCLKVYHCGVGIRGYLVGIRLMQSIKMLIHAFQRGVRIKDDVLVDSGCSHFIGLC